MNFLVIGGEGFIGRFLKNKLRQKGHIVQTLDIAGNPTFKVNILDYASLQTAMNDMDGVFHLAAVTSPPQFETDLTLGFETNVNGTLNILKASLEKGVKRVVIASSSAIYGDINEPGQEDFTIDGHNNMYATTKLFDEYLAKYFHLRKDLETVSLRFFNTYGIGENTKGMYSSVISKFLEAISKGELPVIYGDGTQSRDFVYVKDLAEASYQAFFKGKSGETYNVGTGNSISFNELIAQISTVIGKEIEIKYESNPFKNYQMFTKADITKILSQIGWSPSYSTKDGIAEMANEMGLI